MIPIPSSMAEEVEALRGAALVELAQLAEDTGLDLSPPDPAWLSDLALNTGRAIDEAVAEIAELAQCCGRPIARRRARALARHLAEELLAELELAALGVA